MAVVHFLGEEIEEYIEGFREQIVSFSAGVSISYIFIQLLPEFHRIAFESSQLIFVAPLLGFSSVHLAEKYLAQKDLSYKKMRRDYSELHFGFLMLYHIALGYLIPVFLSQDTASGVLFFIPVTLHLAFSSLSISELHENFTSKLSVKTLTSSAPVIGTTIYFSGLLNRTQFNPIFGAVIGMFFYIVIRDSIPQDNQGRPKEYILGLLLYLMVIGAVNLI